MAGEERSIETHYSVTNLGEAILNALKNMGKDIDALTPADLALVDEFHIRGRDATQELAHLADVKPHFDVLDVGCGLGGSARYLAYEYGCRVSGLDLTEEYCQVASLLSARLGLSSSTEFRQGSALAMPFDDQRFDLGWTEHVQMNIADKAGFYGEIVRVLKPGGKLAFHDIFYGKGGELRFPVPWAGDPSINFLIALEALEDLLQSVGLRTRHWEDKTQASIEWYRQAIERIRSDGPTPLGLHLLMGPDSRIKFENTLRNLEQGCIVVVQAVLEKPS
jgi:ubiquinone/menaquinone biosynthesis C-methylase UbiE